MSVNHQVDVPSKANDRIITSDESIAYAALFLASFIGFAYLLALNAQVSLYWLCGPALLIAFCSFFFRIFSAIVVPCFVFSGLVLYGLFNRSTLLSGWEAHAIVISGLVSIVASARWLACNKPTTALSASRRVNYSPYKLVRATMGRVGQGHLFTVLLLLLAWWFASYLSGQLAVFARSPRAYDQALGILHTRLGILPEWYVGLKVVFLLTIVLWLCRQFFEFLTLRRRQPSVAAMHLRSELWRWDGSEQRLVGRQLGKQHRD